MHGIISVFFRGQFFWLLFFLKDKIWGKILDYFSRISLNNFTNFFGNFCQIYNITKIKFKNPDHVMMPILAGRVQSFKQGSARCVLRLRIYKIESW